MPNSSIFGTISNPTKYAGAEGQGLFSLIYNLIRLAIVIGGIFFIIQLILAGFAFLSASGDPKKIEVAWSKIWQSLIGIVILASVFTIAAVVGRLTGITILTPTIYGPGN